MPKQNKNLANNTGPAVVDSNARAVDDTGTRAVSQVHAEPSNLIQIAGRSLHRLVDGVHLLVALHVHTGLEHVGNVGVHSTHHHGVAANALVAIEGGSVLGQSNQAVLAGSISGT